MFIFIIIYSVYQTLLQKVMEGTQSAEQHSHPKYVVFKVAHNFKSTEGKGMKNSIVSIFQTSETTNLDISFAHIPLVNFYAMATSRIKEGWKYSLAEQPMISGRKINKSIHQNKQTNKQTDINMKGVLKKKTEQRKCRDHINKELIQ